MNDSIRRAGALLASLAQDDEQVGTVADWLLMGAKGDLHAFLGETEHRRRDIDARNRLLRDAARLFFGQFGRADQARRLSDGLERYREGEWRTACLDAVCPHPANTLIAAYWHALRAKDAPLRYRQMLRVLSPR